MKNVFKFGILALLISFFSVSCGSGNGDKDKDKSDSTAVKALKKDAEVDPTTGCD